MTDRERLVERIQISIPPSSSHWAEVIADELLADGWMRPPVKVGDYVEWDNGIGANKRLHQIKGFYYEPENGLRYDLGVVCPIITHQAIKRIVPREEALKALKGGEQ